MKKVATLSARSCTSLAVVFLLGSLAVLASVGCRLSGHTSDSRLRQIDEMLDSQLPAGTPRSRVSFYLSSQGFPLESTNDPQALVAIVHHVDTETLRPASARVTFRFDPSDRLKTYELSFVAGSTPQP